MNKKELLADIDTYAKALSKASRWHDSEQSICFCDEIASNKSNRFYIQEFLDMLKHLEHLQSKHYTIRLEPGDQQSPYLFSWENRSQQKQPEFKAIRGTEELHVSPQIPQSSLEKASPDYGKGIIIRIRDIGFNHKEKQIKIPNKLAYDTIDKLDLPAFDIRVIEGLPEDCVFAVER